MARSTRGGRLETREGRLRLPIAKKPVFVRIGPGVGLGYRRNQSGGTWVVRAADGAGGNWTKALGAADDFEEADGQRVLDFWQAQDRARVVARAGGDGGEGDARPATVAMALDRYESDLKTRGGDTNNVARVRSHLPDALGAKRVSLLASRDLRHWRDGLAKTLAPATVNRTSNAMRAALNLAADNDERIVSRQAWEIGLAAIPDAEESRNVILAEPAVRAIVEAAYKPTTLQAEQLQGEARRKAEQEAQRWANAFGLLVEVAAVTGARVSQLARLEAQDVQGGRADPRLMMPSSRKGRGQRKTLRRPVPIPADLAARLASVAEGDGASDTLLLKPSGKPWRKSDHSRPFARAAKAAGLDPGEVTLYALRHSSIVRMLLAGIPARVVAAHHDTSIAMLEKTYSRFIADHADTLARRALLDTSAPAGGNVVRIGTGG
jgi:integrase